MDDKLLLRRLVENQIRIRHRRHAANGGIIGAGPDVRVLKQQIDDDLDAGLNAAGQLTGTSFYAGGQPTPPALLPPQGSGITASYNGSYIANLQSPASYAGATIPAGPFSGSAQITAEAAGRANL